MPKDCASSQESQTVIHKKDNVQEKMLNLRLEDLKGSSMLRRQKTRRNL